MPIILSAALSLTGLAIGLVTGTALAAGALVAARSVAGRSVAGRSGRGR